jgi:hypothetical protein
MTEPAVPAGPRPGKSTNVRSQPAASGRGERPSSRLLLLRAGLAVGTAMAPRLAARWAESLFFTPPRPRRASTSLPPGAQRLEVSGSAGPLAAWSWGGGPAVYLVHGWGGRAEQLGAFVAPIVDRGFRVVALDGPGHGLSAGRLSSGPEIGRALACVAARVAPAHAVVAHSLGAAAVAFAMREGLAVGRLAFIGPPADPLTWVAAFARRLGLRPAIQAEMRRRSEVRLRARWDDLPLVPLRGIADPPPLLVVHDRDDREVPWADGAAVATAWPGAVRLDTNGLGHRRVLRDPAVVARVAAFIDGDDGLHGPGDDEACGHGRRGNGPCEACTLESELFVPALRQRARPSAPAQR